MKVIKIGTTYQAYNDELEVFDKLPAQAYSVSFSKSSGFFLDKHTDIVVRENKIYGIHMSKANKVLNAFPYFNKNLGVILSGDKGIGKSLFAKILATEAIKRDIPVLIVDSYIPGIADFIAFINQEVMVIFDEYDKTFGGIKAPDGAADPQTELLTLFDGLYDGKKLFVITCNELRNLSDFLVNRPGRFHYHFRFDYPDTDDITEYMQDKLPKEKYGEITKVISFSKKVPLNYDCLRAIAFEINHSGDFENAIKDLNIVNTSSVKYAIYTYMKDGRTNQTFKYLDLFDKSEKFEDYIYIDNGCIYVSFRNADCVFDTKRGINYVPGEYVEVKANDVTDEDDTKLAAVGVDHIEVIRCEDKALHYAV